MKHCKTTLTLRRLLALGLLPLLAAGCSIYQPQVVDLPLISHRGDGRVDASAGLSVLMSPAVGVSASYGFTDWLAGQAFVSYGGTTAYAQASPGVYFPLGGQAVLETYAGMGVGGLWTGQNDMPQEEGGDLAYSFFFDGHFMLPFVQVNAGWHNLGKGLVSLAFGLKAGAFFPSFNYRQTDASGQPQPELDDHYRTTNLLVEPQVQFSIGGEKLKYTFRIGAALLSDMMLDRNKNFIYSPLTVSNGLTFSF